MIKHIFLTLLLLTATLLAETDLRLNHYPRALEWLKDADTNGESAYNIGVLYHKEIKDNDKAIEWYKKACVLNDKNALVNATINLGNIYKKSHQYNETIFYYKKAYALGDASGANGLGFLYEHKLNDNKNAEKWYKKAIKDNNQKAIGNLAKLYHKQKKTTLGSAYLISLVGNGYTKQKVLNYLKTKWNLTDEEIKEAYKLQKTLDIPKHYYNQEFEEKTLKQKSDRR